MKIKKGILAVCGVIAVASFLAPLAGQGLKPANQNIKVPRAPTPLFAPKITSASYICLGASGREFGVYGQYFGAAQGSQRVLVNGHPIPGVSMWGPETISGTGPVWDIDHSYDIAIDDGTHVISNVLTKRFPFQWDAALPGHAPAGAEIDLVGWGGGPAQTDKVVKVGSAVAVVLSWTQSSPTVTENHIHIRVPALPAGTYPITVWKAGVNVTKAPLNFTVN
jgi:hypothetical protein